MEGNRCGVDKPCEVEVVGTLVRSNRLGQERVSEECPDESGKVNEMAVCGKETLNCVLVECFEILEGMGGGMVNRIWAIRGGDSFNLSKWDP